MAANYLQPQELTGNRKGINESLAIIYTLYKMDTNTFIYSTYINPTPETLWDALTRSEVTRQYWGGLNMNTVGKVGAPVQLIYPWRQMNW